MLRIYSQNGTLKAEVSPSESSTLTHELQGDNVLSVSFELFEHITFQVNDYTDFLGSRYTLLEVVQPTQVSTVEWSYSLRFYGQESLIKRFLVLNETDGYNPVFALTDTARVHVGEIVKSINHALGTTVWKTGEVIATENLVLNYEGTYCHEALKMLADAAKTEWWIEGTTINLSRCEHGASGDNALTLGYGQGLINLSRDTADGAKLFTRLYPIGSSRNFEPGGRLELPNGAKYVESDLKHTYGVIHHFEKEAFSHIYPRRTGVVSSVQKVPQTKDGKPFDVFYFKDENIDFNPNTYKIGGLVMRVTFESGELQGREFDCNYNAAKNEFELITQFPYDNDKQVPNDVLKPKAGDQYILWNLKMPDQYVVNAQDELLKAVNEYIADKARDVSVYKATTDFEYLQRHRVELKVGLRVKLLSDEFFPAVGFRDSRITRISRRVHTPELADIEISDAISNRTMERLQDSITQVNHRIREVATAMPDLIRSWESTAPTDSNIYSAKAVKEKHLSRLAGDTAKGKITFEKGISIGDNYVAGLMGSGGNIDHLGNAELESLTLRRWLEVPELRYNRTTVHVGASFNSPCAGIVERVENLTTSTGRVYLKLEDGELGTMEPGDLLMGIFHATQQNGGAIADTDNGKLDVTFAGFATVYFEVTATDSERKWFDYRLREGTRVHPSPFMTFASRGNRHTPERQRFVFATRDYTRYLVNVNDWATSPANIAVQVGDLTKVGDTAIPPSLTFGLYGNNVFLRQSLVVRGNGSTQTIDEALADTATALQERLLAQKLSTRNLVPNSAYRHGRTPHFGKTNNGGANGLHALAELRTVDGEPALLVQARGNPATQQGIWLGTNELTQNFADGEEFVCTFEIKGRGNFRDCSLEGQAVEGNLSNTAIPTEWTRVTWRGTFRQNGGAFIWYMQPQLYHNGQWRSWADTGLWGQWQALATADYSTLNDAQRSQLANFEAKLPHFYLRHLKVVKGNQTDGYSEAPEDVDYLRRAFADTTEVAGGVVLSSVVGVRDGGGNVTAYLNGRTNEGGYALATGVTAFGTQNEQAKSWLDFGGNAKFGDLRIGRAGDGKVWVEDNAGNERIVFTPDNVPDLASKLRETGQDVTLTLPQQRYVSGNASNFLFQNVQVLHSGTELTLVGKLQLRWQHTSDSQSYNRDVFPRGGTAVTLIVRRMGTRGAEDTDIATWTLHGTGRYHEVVTSEQDINVRIPNLQAGTHHLELSIRSWEGHGGATVPSGATARVLYELDKQAMVLGRDGLSLFWGLSRYFHLKNGELAFKGNTDLPGVLASGTVELSKDKRNTWGAKANNISATVDGNSIYTIPHNVGHSEYSINVIAHTERLTPVIVSRGNTSFRVKFQNPSGSATQTAFDYQLFGRN